MIQLEAIPVREIRGGLRFVAVPMAFGLV
ncbi:hypothetical protein MTR67_032840 [Solanum verrucosum]|uniref:Uncharacterized protein n=1 Tax=Solanum verrucosum TaxID=315347 RepID=A0AAF0ZIF2_SOLVR|nr:hypothetical protein MTR67_032840 [Solanum verrucosum]